MSDSGRWQGNARVLAVSLGKAIPLVVAGAGTEAVVLSGIRKHPVSTLLHPLSVQVRPLGLDSIEFDDAGKAVISFVPIRPGTFTFHAPENTAEGMSGTFIVK